jgi:hypothetical protein
VRTPNLNVLLSPETTVVLRACTTTLNVLLSYITTRTHYLVLILSITPLPLPYHREREAMRQIVTQLRQDNTELRHRLRQLESRLSAAAAAAGTSKSAYLKGLGNAGSNSVTAALSADLAASNNKLRKQVS